VPDSSQPAPFSHAYDLGAIPDRGVDLVLSPSPAERAAIADWLGILGVNGLKATIHLSRKGDEEFAYSGTFSADVVQACVITLQPVPAHVEGEFRRLFRVLRRTASSRRRAAHEPPAAVEISALDEEEMELLESPMLDLAAPLLEELSLALDPYPKAPGVVFEAPADQASPEESPFAVLQKLKPR
jgi:uncharacterized metal-binding protein YceD (DUF177 family)